MADGPVSPDAKEVQLRPTIVDKRPDLDLQQIKRPKQLVVGKTYDYWNFPEDPDKPAQHEETITILGKPYKKEDELWIKVKVEELHPDGKVKIEEKEISLADKSIVPYRNDRWNNRNYLTPQE